MPLQLECKARQRLHHLCHEGATGLLDPMWQCMTFRLGRIAHTYGGFIAKASAKAHAMLLKSHYNSQMCIQFNHGILDVSQHESQGV